MLVKREFAKPYRVLILILGLARVGLASDPVIYFTYRSCSGATSWFYEASAPTS